ncbi:hypothetical protein FA15DRAFT_663603 [Coprinopsis marcescibilis]|uniref:F-box domain-containing protein n=1 Tax=Coprinopsis marcescibilis TaxID=230819 RepID=A0A5C3LE55_COPMA|nr:hypothetical protein FA15DRAFT_663603 [Coprinopsis marcescibilis]
MPENKKARRSTHTSNSIPLSDCVYRRVTRGNLNKSKAAVMDTGTRRKQGVDMTRGTTTKHETKAPRTQNAVDPDIPAASTTLGNKKEKTAAESAPTRNLKIQFHAAQPPKEIFSSMMTVLPLEVLLEIFKQAQPEDLLSLCRTSKALRRILLNRALAGSVWRETFQNVEPKMDLPPQGLKSLNWIMLAQLAYGEQCFECDTAYKTATYWVEYTRLCEECFQKKSVEIKLSEDQLDKDLREIVWHTNRKVDKGSKHLCLQTTYEKHKSRLLSLQSNTDAYNQYLGHAKKEANLRKMLSKSMQWWVKERAEQRRKEFVHRLVMDWRNSMLDPSVGL